MPKLPRHRPHREGWRELPPLFPIDFDGNEVLVENRRHLLVLVRFSFHDVAPVAGRVTDAQEDWLVVVLGPRQRLPSPWVPVNRVVGVLQKVGALLLDQSIRLSHLSFTQSEARSGFILIEPFPE